RHHRHSGAGDTHVVGNQDFPYLLRILNESHRSRNKHHGHNIHQEISCGLHAFNLHHPCQQRTQQKKKSVHSCRDRKGEKKVKEFASHGHSPDNSNLTHVFHFSLFSFVLIQMMTSPILAPCPSARKCGFFQFFFSFFHSVDYNNPGGKILRINPHFCRKGFQL